MMAAVRALVAIATIVFIFGSAAATNYTVGAPSGGWDLQTDFATWASSHTFVAGDNLIFSYTPKQHNVLEVSKADYDKCAIANPMMTYSSGHDVVPLMSATTRYFICGIPTHCPAGMKVPIKIVDAGMGAPSPAAPPSMHSGADRVRVGFGLGLILILVAM